MIEKNKSNKSTKASMVLASSLFVCHDVAPPISMDFLAHRFWNFPLLRGSRVGVDFPEIPYFPPRRPSVALLLAPSLADPCLVKFFVGPGLSWGAHWRHHLPNFSRARLCNLSHWWTICHSRGWCPFWLPLLFWDCLYFIHVWKCSLSAYGIYQPR